MQPINQVNPPTETKPTKPTRKPTETREATKIDWNYRDCPYHGHKWADCRKRLREEASARTSKPQKCPKLQK